MFFFPIACAVYFVVPRKLRVLWLLVCSYAFYMAWNVKYAGLMAVSTLATYASGLALDSAQNELKRTLRQAQRTAVPDSSRKAILAALKDLAKIPVDELVERRYQKIRSYGNFH